MFRIIGWTLEVEGLNRDEASTADKSPGFPGWIPPENKSRQQSACQNKSAGIFIHSPEIHQAQNHRKKIPTGATQPTVLIKADYWD